MIEYDEKEDETRAYKRCMQECKKSCYDSHDCRERNGDAETLCRDGADDDSLKWDGFLMNNKLINACKTINTPPATKQEPEHPFNAYELWRLFDTE